MNIFRRKTSGARGKRREVRFAGTWYEDDQKKLSDQVQEYLGSAREVISINPCDKSFSNNPQPADNLLALVVPHAGYMFSGSTAAFAYEFARANKKPKRVFLLGPSHYVGFQGIALSGFNSFATPLGDLEVDSQCVKELSGYAFFDYRDEVHQKEHSLELQLSFIKQAFGDVKLVPLIVGVLNEESELALAAQILKRYIGPDDLIVVSSDFTHYGPRYDYVPFESDHINKVKQLDENAFSFIRDVDLPGFIDFHDRTGCTICGFHPCSLLLAMLPSQAKATLLRYGTSLDTYKEDDSNSVSYLSLVLTSDGQEDGWLEKEHRPKEELLSQKDKESLLLLARKTLESSTNNEELPSIKSLGIELTENLKESLGVFVTLFKKLDAPVSKRGPRSDKELRGCIGYIWPIKPLYLAVIDNAIGSSQKDHRFPRVGSDELSKIQIEISVLTPLRRVQSVEDIEIGVHGIVFYHGNCQSVFLPHVATEFGWSKEETLIQLSLKAGLGSTAWKDKEAQFDVFESIMFEEEN